MVTKEAGFGAIVNVSNGFSVKLSGSSEPVVNMIVSPSVTPHAE